MTDNRKIELFRDWFNNFLTLERYAEYYGIDEAEALWTIEQGRDLHEASCTNGGK